MHRSQFPNGHLYGASVPLRPLLPVRRRVLHLRWETRMILTKTSKKKLQATLPRSCDSATLVRLCRARPTLPRRWGPGPERAARSPPGVCGGGRSARPGKCREQKSAGARRAPTTAPGPAAAAGPLRRGISRHPRGTPGAARGGPGKSASKTCPEGPRPRRRRPSGPPSERCRRRSRP